MKSRFVVATVVAVALACLAEPILAQQPGGQGGQPGQRGQRGPGGGGFGGGGFGGGGFGGALGGMFGGGGRGTSRLGLLNIPEVQKELELVDEQLTAIQKVRDELQPQRGRGGFGGGQPGQPGQPGQRGRRGGDNPPPNPNGGNGASLASPERFYVQQEAQPPQPGQRGQRGQGGPGGGFGQLTEEQRAEMEKQRAVRLKQEKEKLADILLPHQVKRLNEIYYQQLGVSVVDDPDAIEELKITAEQKAKIAEVRTANQESMRTLMQEVFANRGAGGAGGEGGAGGAGGAPGGRGGRGGFGGFQLTEEQQKKMDDARKANDEKILAVLTAEQRTKLDEMKGKAFAMPENAGRGRGGFGGPGGAPGGAPGRGRGGNDGNNNN
jgi:Spy/CpxP family protein refolding chaperone